MATRSNGVVNVRSGKEGFDNEDDDDVVQIYGTSIESAPLKPKRTSIPEDSIVVKIEDRFRDMKILDRLRLPDDAMSKDSDSLINAANYYSPEKYDPRNGWWKHPKVKENWKIVLAAFVLLIIGLGLLVSGVIVEVIPTKAGYKGLVFFIAGAICFIPGVYHVVYVYCAVKGRRGFDFHNLPLFN